MKKLEPSSIADGDIKYCQAATLKSLTVVLHVIQSYCVTQQSHFKIHNQEK